VRNSIGSVYSIIPIMGNRHPFILNGTGKNRMGSKLKRGIGRKREVDKGRERQSLGDNLK
jgi:hypothetical protein